ncbi:hypothetical protein B0H12DRAFT_1226987 [Mycena haematopus]|nr:hypothetical protein B0H12DRAFT_1226987 [Mycena haematopus]
MSGHEQTAMIIVMGAHTGMGIYILLVMGGTRGGTTAVKRRMTQTMTYRALNNTYSDGFGRVEQANATATELDFRSSSGSAAVQDRTAATLAKRRQLGLDPSDRTLDFGDA